MNMNMKFKFILSILFMTVLFISPVFSQVKIIFDTDLGGDADDLRALVMLNNFIDKEEIELLPITFSGFEIGNKIKTGKVFNRLDENSPLYQGFMHFSKNAPWVKENYKGEILDNASYDQTAVLYAVRGGLGTYWDKVENGHCEIDENGDNRWVEGEKTNHSYLILKL